MKTIQALNRELKQAAAARTRRVRRLRKAGLTWAAIGAILKISRQRAQQIGSR